MKSRSVDEPLSDEELDQLSEFLKNVGPPALTLEGVDGLFCALICGPETVPMSEYFPEILGEDFIFDNQEDVGRLWDFSCDTGIRSLAY